MSSKAFPLLDLPAEIRIKIYTHVCVHPFPYISLSSSNTPVYFPQNLILASSQLYQEVRPVYFSSNAFSLTIRRRNDSFSSFLSPFFRDSRRQIRTLRIHILRWGSKNFFPGCIVPMLEDCILNGRLRILDIVVSEAFLKSLERSRESGAANCAGEEFESWRLLCMVLKDPYLEAIRLMASSTRELNYESDIEGVEEGSCRDVTWMLKNRIDGSNGEIPDTRIPVIQC